MIGRRRKLVSALVVGLGLTLTVLGLVGHRLPARADSGPLHVAPGGDCGGASLCYATVQAAVDAASSGDEIWVAAGTYTGVHARTPPGSYDGPPVITQVVYISKTVTIRGGYTSDFSGLPDPEENPAVLDAEGQGRVMFIGEDISPTIEGLYLTGGDAGGLQGDHWGYDAGGGVFMWYSDAEVTLSENWVISNTAAYGGGLYLYKGAPNLTGNTVISNTGTLVGGGLFLYSSDGEVTANTVIYNATTASGGGGLFLFYSDPVVSGNIVSFNSADTGGGGLYVQGGVPAFVNNVIADNRAGNTGGGILLQDCSPGLVHTTLARNSSRLGSGVYVWGGAGSNPTLTNTILFSHTEGVYVREGNTATLNAILWHNNGTDYTGNAILLNDISGDPDFGADGYHLGSASAAIDVGVDAGVTVDINGDPRPVGDGHDLGADERLLRIYVPLIVRGYDSPGSWTHPRVGDG